MMKKRGKKRGMTLLEVMIVVIIMGILLGITIGLGNSYVRTMQVKKDKEQFISLVDNFLAIARTSNYYRGERYSTMSVVLSSGSVLGILDTLTEVDTLTLTKSELVFTGGSFTVELTPYQLSCENPSDTSSTGQAFTLESTINSDVYCFLRDFRVCKLQLQVCD